ncbi:MAG TPA: hypothetical protein VK469_22130 [Candidatus Kapabacteria bacterium]|nr:hypothetical protein [Candidatus Kapabacteria bacterium]
MNKKITATAMLIIFMSVSFSCNSYYTKKIRLQEGRPLVEGNTKILTVYTKSRQLIEFLNKTPAVVFGDNIVGFIEDETGHKKIVSIPISEAEVLWVKKWDAGGTLVATFAGVGVFWLFYLIKDHNH